MENLKKMEKALLLEWRKLQLEINPLAKANAIIAYYVNYRAYQCQKAYFQRLDLKIS